MARPVFSPTDDAYTRDFLGRPVAGVPVRVFAARIGGSPITDLVYVDAAGNLGSSVPSGILTSDGDGLIPTFAGPDGGATKVWVNTGQGGTRNLLQADPTGGGGSGGSQFTSVFGKTSGTVTGADVAADSTVAGAFAALNSVASVATTNGALTPGRHNPVDSSGGSRTMTLANAATDGIRVSVEKTDATTNTVTVTLNLRGNPGASISLIAPNESLEFLGKADGSWWPVAGHRTKVSLDNAYGAGSDNFLKNEANWDLTTSTATDSTTGLTTTGTVTWRDGKTGAFTGTVTGNDYSGYVVTWVNGGTTKTVTASGFTYNVSGTRLGPTSLVVS